MNPPLVSSPAAGRWLNWLLVGLVILVTALAGMAINSLSHRADASRHAETTLARIEQKASELNALEWEAMHRGRFTPELAGSVAKSRQEMQAQFGRLGGLGFKLPQIEEVAERFEAYSKLVDEEFKLLASGKIKEAEELDEAKVDPAFDELSESLGGAGAAFDVFALSDLRQVRLWTFAILLAAAAAVGLLFWQFYEKQRAAELAATEQRVLQQANAELENRVRERTAELAALNRQIGISARQAGMAEVANSVLHNVGNALNSVNVSASLVIDTLAQSRLADLPAAAALLQEHRADLGAFLTQDEQGRQFPGFLQALAGQWQTEQALLAREAAALNKHVQHVREIIQRQQSLSGVSGIIECVLLTEVINDALALNAPLLEEKGVRVRREIKSAPAVQADRSKLTQILVNLVRNAAQALADGGAKEKEITIRTGLSPAGRVLIHVADNGPGIPGENLANIFSYGFTTKKDGHGFGLHGSVLGAREMDGTLRAHSDGPGRGAMFTIELPAPVTKEMPQAA